MIDAKDYLNRHIKEPEDLKNLFNDYILNLKEKEVPFQQGFIHYLNKTQDHHFSVGYLHNLPTEFNDVMEFINQELEYYTTHDFLQNENPTHGKALEKMLNSKYGYSSDQNITINNNLKPNLEDVPTEELLTIIRDL